MHKWLSKKYLDEEWYALLEESKDKEIICYGAGTSLYTVPKFMPNNIKIAYYIDVNYEKWKDNVYDIEVKHPNSVKKLRKGSFLVLIAGQHTVSMIKQLEEYGLQENVDFINMYGKYEKAFRLAKIDYRVEKMLGFIKRSCMKNLEQKNVQNKKIGVIMTSAFVGSQGFDIALYMLLKYYGYDVELIVDDVYSIENKSIYEGITQDISFLNRYLLDELCADMESCTVKYISDYYYMESLSEGDISIINEVTHLNSVWIRSRNMEHILMKSENEWYEQFYSILENNFRHVKAFFEENEYDVINIFTGIHAQRFFYTQLCQQKGMRVSTYDGADYWPCWSANGGLGHMQDIPFVIQNNLFSEIEKTKIIEKSKKEFAERRKLIGENFKKGIYQIGEKKKITDDWYDVIIPLNVMNDAAALGRNRIFSSENDWLIETISYILNNTNANILIREHPMSKEYACNIDSVEKLIELNFPNEPRLYYADRYSVLNTYTYLEHCKVVLPFTSTIGVEAALLDKAVVTHSKVYYDCFKFVYRAENKTDYFRLINELLDDSVVVQNKDDAYLAYYLANNWRKPIAFNETVVEWMNLSISEISKLYGVEDIVKNIVDGIPIMYSVVKDRIEEVGA